MFPSEARLRNLTYAGSLMVDMIRYLQTLCFCVLKPSIRVTIKNPGTDEEVEDSEEVCLLLIISW